MPGDASARGEALRPMRPPASRCLGLRALAASGSLRTMSMDRAEKTSPTSETFVRDTLARDRTVLANERTLLAYIRTALALSGAGATFITFFDSRAMLIVGWTLVPLGALAMVVGAWRYLRMRSLIWRRARSSRKTELLLDDGLSFADNER